MYRILVAVDGSERADRAAQFAVELAGRIEDAELNFINVQDPVEESQTHGLARDAILKHRETLAVATGDAATSMATRAGIRSTFAWQFGEPAHVVADVAGSTRCDLIVMGTQGAGAIQNLVLGSVAERALHLSKVPIALIR